MAYLETIEKIGLDADIRQPSTFLLDNFFPRVRETNKKKIQIDLLMDDRRLAPFAMPNTQGKPVADQGWEAREFEPAYVKMVNLIKPEDLICPLPGEAINGDRSPAERRDIKLMEWRLKHEASLKNRLEWMASQILLNGNVVIDGDDYPSVTLNFNRDPLHNIALAGGALWTNPSSTPLQDINQWNVQMQKSKFGGKVTDIIFGSDAWGAFKMHQDAMDERKVDYRGTSMLIESSRLEDIEGDYVGTLDGRTRLWLYSECYVDDTGTEKPFVDPDCVVMISRPRFNGIQCYGFISDMDYLNPTQLFTKEVETENPSGITIISQSAPLLVPYRPNASFKAQVI